MFTDNDDELHNGLLHLITFYNVGADDDIDYEEDGYDDVDDDLYALIMYLCHLLVLHMGVVGCGKGVVYLTSPGHPNDTGLQLGKLQAQPAIFIAGRGSGGMFLFLLFLHFHSCSSFFPVPIFYLLFMSFSLYLGDDTK